MNKSSKGTRGLEVNIGDMLAVLVRKWWIILLAGIAAASVFLIGTKLFIEPEYESVTKIYVLSQQDGNYLTSTDLQLSSYLTKDYAELIKSRKVAMEVIDRLDLDISPEGLMSKVNVQTKADTRIVTIIVNDVRPERAQELANSICEVSAKQIVNVMGVQAVNVVDEANLPLSPSSPNLTKSMMLGGAWGCLVAIILILFIHLSDDTIKNIDDVAQYLNLSVLASIPNVEPKENKKRRLKVWQTSN